MKKIRIEQDIQIPGTDILLESGDMISIMSGNDRMSEGARAKMMEVVEEACDKREGDYREAGRLYEREMRECGYERMAEAWDDFEEGMKYEMGPKKEYPMESTRKRSTSLKEGHSEEIARALANVMFSGGDADDAQYLAEDFAKGIMMGIRNNPSIAADPEYVLMMLVDNLASIR